MIPFTVIIVHFFISVSLLTGSRLFIKYVYYQLSTPSAQLQNILLFGAVRDCPAYVGGGC